MSSPLANGEHYRAKDLVSIKIEHLRHKHHGLTSPTHSGKTSARKEDRPRATCGINVQGVYVSHVIPGGPAHGRIKRGDLIRAIDGHLATAANIKELLIGLDIPGSNVEIEIQGLRSPVILERGDSQRVGEIWNLLRALSECREEARTCKQDTIADQLNALEPCLVKLLERVSAESFSQKAHIVDLEKELMADEIRESKLVAACDDANDEMRRMRIELDVALQNQKKLETVQVAMRIEADNLEALLATSRKESAANMAAACKAQEDERKRYQERIFALQLELQQVMDCAQSAQEKMGIPAAMSTFF
jgi:hypothetical protein